MESRWAIIFKAFANRNRLKIVNLLGAGQVLNVSQISRELKISVKSTSKHLSILRGLEVLEYVGKHGHVLYAMNPHLPHDIYMVTRLFIH